MSDDLVYIDSFEMENVKRVKAVKIVCDGNALTLIGGRNKQGKTTILDGLAYLFG